MEAGVSVIALAFILDLLVGDPETWPHPIRWMGRSIEAFEPRFRKLSISPIRSGALFALSLILGSFLTAWLLRLLAWKLHPAAGLGVEMLMLFYCISVRSLEKAAMRVYTALREDGLHGARAAVSRIVGRETRHLDEPELIRAAVETVAENLVDGVLSPLFYALLGGAPLAVAYKMTNTLDSMVGYKNEKYRYFGRAAARIDDAANYIPARLSVLFIAAAAQLIGKKGRPALLTGYREGRRHTSPNAGFSEAAFAGALGVRLGGPGIYHGRVVEKPYLGETHRPAKTADIPRACQLMVVTGLLWMAVVQVIAAVIMF